MSLTDRQLDALWEMIESGAHRAKGEYHTLAVRRLIRLGYAVATSDTTTEITPTGREAYAQAR